MKRKPIFPMTTGELEALATKQLLTRLKRLHRCEASSVLSDREARHPDPPESIEFKDTAEWTAAYHQLKEILARREHVLKGAELVELRHQKARKGKSLERRTGKRQHW